MSSVGVAEIPRGTLGRRVGRRLTDWLPAAVVLVGGILLWEGLVRALDVQRFLLPAPSAILDTLWERRSELFDAGLYTFSEAFGGFVVGCSLAVLAAIGLARFRRLARSLLPFAIAANAVPIIAFAPITNQWFGPLEKTSKMAIAAILVFFPVLVNTLRGLTSVRPSSIELMRSYAAGEVQIFRRVRVPNALPYIFSGAEAGDRARDDRRDRGRVLPQLAGGARLPDQELGGALPVRGRLGGDRRRERARNPLLRIGRARRAADDELAPVDAT